MFSLSGPRIGDTRSIRLREADVRSSRIRAVFLDVGETLVDETREYATWADWLGVPRHTFSSVFGAVIAAGRDYREAFGFFRPGFDLAVEREARAGAGQPETFGEDDLYPDVRECLADLRGQGLVVGVAGNQTARAIPNPQAPLHRLRCPSPARPSRRTATGPSEGSPSRSR
jgi:beta-phosphoglucomutase-like phosphatase (HAD superfamily)